VRPVLAAEAGDIYRLPEHMRDAVEQQYRRDVQRVHGEDAGRFDDEYKSFIQVGGWLGVGQLPAGSCQPAHLYSSWVGVGHSVAMRCPLLSRGRGRPLQAHNAATCRV